MTATAGVGLTWALFVLGDSTVRAYDAWAVHQWLVRTVKVSGPGVVHSSGLGSGVFTLLSALDFLVFYPLTLLWLVLTVAAFLSGRRGRPDGLYLTVVVVAVGAQILFSMAGAAASTPTDPFHPTLFTPAMDFVMLLAFDGLIALVGSVWFWRRASR